MHPADDSTRELDLGDLTAFLQSYQLDYRPYLVQLLHRGRSECDSRGAGTRDRRASDAYKVQRDHRTTGRGVYRRSSRCHYEVDDALLECH